MFGICIPRLWIHKLDAMSVCCRDGESLELAPGTAAQELQYEKLWRDCRAAEVAHHSASLKVGLLPVRQGPSQLRVIEMEYSNMHSSFSSITLTACGYGPNLSPGRLRPDIQASFSTIQDGCACGTSGTSTHLALKATPDPAATSDCFSSVYGRRPISSSCSSWNEADQSCLQICNCFARLWQSAMQADRMPF